MSSQCLVRLWCRVELYHADASLVRKYFLVVITRHLSYPFMVCLLLRGTFHIRVWCACFLCSKHLILRQGMSKITPLTPCAPKSCTSEMTERAFRGRGDAQQPLEEEEESCWGVGEEEESCWGSPACSRPSRPSFHISGGTHTFQPQRPMLRVYVQ